MIRMTTGGVLKGYQVGLMNSFINQYKSQTTMLTQRNFNSYAEDPSSASLAFQLRRSQSRVEAQTSINDATTHKYEQAFQAIFGVKELLTNRNSSDEAVAWSNVLRGLNDPTGDGRVALGKSLNELADTIIQSMNTTYGDTFVFAGADGMNVPFEFNSAGQLTYRGVPVDAAIPNVMTDTNGQFVEGGIDANGQYDATIANSYLVVSKNPTLISKQAYDDAKTALDDATTGGDADEIKQAQDVLDGFATPLEDSTSNLVTVDEDGNLDPNGAYYIAADSVSTVSKADYEQAEKDVAKLDYMSNEKYFVDIGLGMQENDATGKLIESSAFNAALQGINFLGYGLDDDGDPKNVVSLLKQMANICLESAESGEEWEGSFNWDEFDRLSSKLEISIDKLDVEYVQLSAGTQKLNNNAKLLESDAYNLAEQISGIEDVNMADAISAFLYAQYCYSAALKAGSTILSPSLMDYLS